ncbi:MAG: DUF2088 domain-containing protein, partial [Anaerolineae bacterium]|nr:DUF2088 domain-containing protein [Anaerolineae bacterium]
MDGYPLMATVAPRLHRAPLADVPGAVRAAMARADWSQRLKPGSRVAITAGSRGINNISLVLRTVVDEARARGLAPFLVPAMGSHGGATAQGQLALLAELGVTPERIGAPIHATMDVVELGQTEDGVPVYLDAYAVQADGIIVVNRVKPHTSFIGAVESGLHKMIAIGLGKERAAATLHGYGLRGLREFIPRVARVTLARAPILLGIAILEDGYDQTAEVVGLAPPEIPAREPELLARAREMRARLPFDECDLLIVEQMGKEISGTGMDTAVIGRLYIRGEPDFPAPRIGWLAVLGLTPASHGNATGVGLADIITRRLYESIDYATTYKNVAISGFLERGKIPLVAETQRAAIDLALRLTGREPRVARIRDTLHLERIQVSAALLQAGPDH